MGDRRNAHPPIVKILHVNTIWLPITTLGTLELSKWIFWMVVFLPRSRRANVDMQSKVHHIQNLKCSHKCTQNRQADGRNVENFYDDHPGQHLQAIMKPLMNLTIAIPWALALTQCCYCVAIACVTRPLLTTGLTCFLCQSLHSEKV